MTKTNTNTNTAIKFPSTKIKSSGAGFAQQNTKLGEFKGRIKALRGIASSKAHTVFGVIDIEVEGELGVFQDYLNFNEAKATESMNYLVNHTKALVQSAGFEVDPNEEKDIAWVQQVITELAENHAEVSFTQRQVNRGLSINYQ